MALAAGGYSWFAGGARAFSAQAGALTAIPDAVVALLAFFAQRRRAPEGGAGTPTEPGSDFAHRGGTRSQPAGGAAIDASPPGAALGRMVAWAAATFLIVCWELIALFSAPRRLWPTASSLYDLAARSRPGEAAVFFLWLLLGWALVGR